MAEKKKPAKKGPAKKLPIKSEEKKKPGVIESLAPDVVVTITGPVGAGKATVAKLISKKLVGNPNGILLYQEEPNTLIANYSRVSKSSVGPVPEWDGRARKILIRTRVQKFAKGKGANTGVDVNGKVIPF